MFLSISKKLGDLTFEITHVDRSQRMYVNIFNRKFTGQNIIEVIMNLHYSP